MSLVAISDVHVKNRNDVQYQLLLKFLTHAKTCEATVICFLGDIFDLMIGSNTNYIKEYCEFFDFIYDSLKRGKKIYFLEGNHDFHIHDLFLNFIKTKNATEQMTSEFTKIIENFHYGENDFTINLFNKKIFLTHGDQFNESLIYPIYRKIIRSNIIKSIVNNKLIYPVVDYVGKKASRASRKLNNKYSKLEKLEGNIIEKAILKYAKDYKIDVIIFGHIHKKIFLEIDNIRILNNGLFAKEHVFAIYSENIIAMNNI